MNTPLRKLLSIFILLIALSMRMELTSVEAGSAPSRQVVGSGASSVSFGWAKAIGGSSDDIGKAIAVDGSGNVYTAGYFDGAVDFDPGPGVYDLTSAGFSDIFVSKLDKGGNFVWAKRIGGSGYDFGLALTVDGSGNVYTTGYFDGTVDFDPGESTYNLSSAGWYDIFVSKLDSSGNFLWAKAMGGSSDDLGNAITVDTTGNVYATGFFRETGDFDPGTGIYNLTSAGEYDIFVSKLDSSGRFIWAKSMGGTGDDYGNAITAGASGNVYSAGYFFSTADFDPGVGIHNLTSAGESDIFVSKLDGSGNFVWAKGMGGTSDEIANGIVVDMNENVFTTGHFLSTADFDPGESVYERSSAGGTDIFVSKLDSGGRFLWAKTLGGSDNEFGHAIAMDGSGNVFTTGYFLSTADFDPGESVCELASTGEADIFVSKLDSAGNFVWANQMGGISHDYGNAITVAASGNVYTTGSFLGISDFDPGVGLYNLTSAGEGDIFISKMVNPVASMFKSTGAEDGWILESSETSNMGGTLNNVATIFYLGDDAQKKQYRSILSFSTKSLPDDAVLTKVTFKVRKQGIAGGGNPVKFFQGVMVDVRKGFFGPAAGLQNSDFQASPRTSLGPFKPALVNGWYTFDLTPAKPYINKLATASGVTQLRLRFQLDDNNNAVANMLKLYSGDAPAASRPQLVIEYYVP